jgi:hypothetical protein
MTRLTGFSFAFASCCVIALGVATAPASAQNTVVFVQADTQQFVDSVKLSQDMQTSSGTRLSDTLGDALQAKKVARLSVVLKCNHYDVIEVTYRDGSIKVVDDPRAPIGRNEPVDRDQLRSLAARLPGFTWGEIECEE